MKQIKQTYINEIVVQKSRFIGILTPLKTKDEVKEKIAELKKEYPKATHYCYGYIIDGLQKSNDDGEPGSSAGKPILESLIRNELNYVLLVVIRYFGGIKLGLGGLTRTYLEASKEVIKKAKVYLETITSIYEIEVEYDCNEILKKYFNQENIKVLDVDYADSIKYLISTNNFDENKLNDFMQGRIKIKFIKTEQALLDEEEDYGRKK